MTDVSPPKQRVREGVSALRSSILDLSHAVHSTPELAYEEVASSRFIADAAAAVPGSRVQVGLGTLPTALLAEVGSGELVVTLCAEYDALPGIGHACGHNIIAASAFGAFAALAPLADELGITVRLLGTPAEEHGGGKIDLLRQGFFDGSHAVLMVHPLHGTIGPVVLRTLASSAYRVTFTGRAAHASAQPWKGVNALDAMTIALTSLGLSRQQLEPGQQIHGFVDGAGDAPNVIPASATGEWMIRATSMESLQRLFPIFRRSFEAGAVATGATLSMSRSEHPYSAATTDLGLCRLFERNAIDEGAAFEFDGDEIGGSSDIANVSNYFPTIHPSIALGPEAPDIHTAPFAAVAGGPAGDAACLSGALLLALTAVDAATDAPTRARLLALAPPDTSSAGSELGDDDATL